MKKDIVKFLCNLEGYKTAVKNLHFSAASMSEHKLMDEIADTIASNQDEIGEICQGIHGQFNKTTIKCNEYKLESSKKFVNDVITSINEFYKKIQGENYVGLRSVVETFIGDMNKYVYLLDLCLKEDFKRSYKNKINEEKNSITLYEDGFQRGMKSESVKLTEKELNECIGEAISNVLGKFVGKYKGCAKMHESIETEAEVQGGMYSDKELNYTHFAVNKMTGLIVDGWDYSGYDSEELKQYKNDYFNVDLKDNGYNPKMYKILSFKGCQKQGIDPNNKAVWSNTGVYPLSQEVQMNKQGQNPYEAAQQEHPDWFLEN